ncbi:hypothetical protein [Spirosoma endbachense]|uniref:Uncharacterized protein n=1 Tax=Spirosoma endbachense TaxID=2666025 RepID=A0A6P1W3R7_9BACT|nr:hypothetical protein [Spirosoma endbachense]QHV98942.1 hypothetical protein GJR95_29785 [Spirosoma endbachense]
MNYVQWPPWRGQLATESGGLRQRNLHWGSLTTYGTTTTGLNGNCSYPDYGHGSTDEYYCTSWELVDTDSYQQCYDTGGTPSPGEGTGPAPQTQPSNPCQDSESLSKNDDFKAKMADLKGKVTQNYESAYTVTGTTYQAFQGEPNTAGVALNITAPINGLIHSHYTGLLSIFSPDDMYAIVGIYKENKMVDPKTFSLGVVTASGTQYLLYIDDLDKFKKFADYITNTGSFDLYSIA